MKSLNSLFSSFFLKCLDIILPAPQSPVQAYTIIRVSTRDASIKGYYSTTLFSPNIINYAYQDWLDAAARHTHLIFVGVPQGKKKQTRKGKMSSSSREDELMSCKKPMIIGKEEKSFVGKRREKEKFICYVYTS